MSKRFAQVQNNIITNIIMVDDDFTDPSGIILTETQPANIGWEVLNGRVKFPESPVVVEAPPEPPSPPPPPQTVFTKYQFRSRFTLAELVATDNFATSSTLTDVQKATLNTITKNFDLADNIDITNSATIQGVEYLVSAGLLTQDRATEILK